MRTWIAISVALIVILYVFGRGLWQPLLHGGNNANVGSALTAENPLSDLIPKENTPAPADLPQNQIAVIDVKTGTGTEARQGSLVSVHYDGFLTDGSKFDSSRVRGETFTFAIGAGQVIPGFEQGVTGMKVGGVRRVVIPASLGYGDQVAGTIPPNSTLLFEIELVTVK